MLYSCKAANTLNKKNKYTKGTVVSLATRNNLLVNAAIRYHWLGNSIHFVIKFTLNGARLWTPRNLWLGWSLQQWDAKCTFDAPIPSNFGFFTLVYWVPFTKSKLIHKMFSLKARYSYPNFSNIDVLNSSNDKLDRFHVFLCIYRTHAQKVTVRINFHPAYTNPG